MTRIRSINSPLNNTYVVDVQGENVIGRVLRVVLAPSHLLPIVLIGLLNPRGEESYGW